MKRKIPKSTWLPIVLLAYLAFMTYIGYDGYAKGAFSALYYFGIILFTLGIIILLHFVLKRKERLRQERENDIN